MSIFFLSILAMIFGLAQEDSKDPLAKHRWEHRVLIIIDQPEGAYYEKQWAQLLKESEGLKERKLVVYALLGKGNGYFQGENLAPKQSEILWNAFSPAFSQSKGILLIGKDGGQKWKKEDLVHPEEIFKIIDQMPMRQREMLKN